MKRATAISLAALYLLAGCSKSGGALSGPDTPLTYTDLPKPKAGVWQTTIDSGNGHPMTAGACLSGQGPSLPKPPENCAQYAIKRTFAGAIVFDSNCPVSLGVMVTHAVMTGDFQSQITTDSQSTLTIQGEAPRTSRVHIDSHWIGPCQPGQTAEDPSGSGATN